jgi:hypothetical protein
MHFFLQQSSSPKRLILVTAGFVFINELMLKMQYQNDLRILLFICLFAAPSYFVYFQPPEHYHQDKS